MSETMELPKEELPQTFKDKIQYFQNWQNDLRAKHPEIQAKVIEIEAEFKAKMEELQKVYAAKAKLAASAYDNSNAKYKAELKAWAGVTDGEPTDIVTLLSALAKNFYVR